MGNNKVYDLFSDLKLWALLNLIMTMKNLWWQFMQGINLILRLAWLQTVLHSSFENVDYRVTSFFLAALEVIRRGLWNFFRYDMLARNFR